MTLEVASACQKIGGLGQRLADAGPLDAHVEFDARTARVLPATARDAQNGCRAGCAVSVGLFKAMQVGAGLALPQDITIKLETSNG